MPPDPLLTRSLFLATPLPLQNTHAALSQFDQFPTPRWSYLDLAPGCSSTHNNTQQVLQRTIGPRIS
jgi:hypothetical protein